MALNSVRFVFVVACLLVSYIEAKRAGVHMSETCANCICEVASGCDIKAGCNGDVCGPLRITRGYWSDAGKPTVDDEPEYVDGAFVRCANDLTCAKKALRGYMDRYGKDCNGNGLINCDDFVRIHRYGPWGCSRPLEPLSDKIYKRCMKPARY